MHRRNRRPSRRQPRLQSLDTTTTPFQLEDETFSRLQPGLQRAIADQGYSAPTPIQSRAIPCLLEGRDLLASAPTGTGKTAAFTLPMLHHLVGQGRRSAPRRPTVLVLAPTRELAAQIGDSVRTYGMHLRIRHLVVHGGVGYGPQVKGLGRGVEILVATPGRLLDLLQSRSVYLDEVKAFILDEVDRMLDMGFIRDIRKIIALVPERRQTVFLSATLPREVENLARTLVQDPVRISVAPEQPTVEKISQKVFFVEKKNKTALLMSLLSDSAASRVVVFTRMKHTANKIAQKLVARGFSAVAIHGNKSQGARTRALDGFKSGGVQTLVATDVAARGLDVEGVTHVINYDLPREPETYVHRIGRTARAGSAGIAFSFCAAEDRQELRNIERTIRKPVPVEKNHPFNTGNHREHQPRPEAQARKKSPSRAPGRGPNRSSKNRRSPKQKRSPRKKRSPAMSQ